MIKDRDYQLFTYQWSRRESNPRPSILPPRPLRS